MRTVKSSQYKLRYQYREYHFSQEQLTHSAPHQGEDTGIFRIYHNLNTLCLILTFHISLAISSRKTAYILQNVFELPASYQTVLNYAKHAATFCHRFNHVNKGTGETKQAGDETYIKIQGKNAYTYFFLNPDSRSISAYHIDHTRDTLPATVAMKEAIRTAPADKPIELITDANPSYQAGIQFLNKERNKKAHIKNIKVVGLQNLDQVSEEFRPFKQMIERLNRTYKFHVKAANGFNSNNGAIVLTTLFVTFYNFIRPHQSLNYKTPIKIDELKGINTIQGKWAQILHMAFEL